MFCYKLIIFSTCEILNAVTFKMQHRKQDGKAKKKNLTRKCFNQIPKAIFAVK